MIIETYPEYTAASRQTVPFTNIGQVWEMEILAWVFSALGPSSLIVSDGLSFLVDRLVRGHGHGGFVRVSDVDDDHGDVVIADYLLGDLQEGCRRLAVAIAEDQCRSVQESRILDAAADHASRICRHICRLA
jgi:hypothetical protein